MRACNEKPVSSSESGDKLYIDRELNAGIDTRLKGLCEVRNHLEMNFENPGEISQILAQYSAVFEIISEPLLVFRNVIIKSNPACVQKLNFDPEGLTFEELIAKTGITLNNSDLRFLRQCIHNKEKVIGKKIEIVSGNWTKTKKISVSLSPVNCKPIENGAIITWRDVTKSEEFEDALRESEERYRIMGDTVPYGTWLSDKDGNFQYFSPSFLELLQMSIEEAKKFGWTKRLVPEDVGPMLNRWMQCVKAGDEWEFEYRILDKNEEIRTVLSKGRPLRDRDGQIIRWVGINLDITERKEMEDELKKIEWLLTKKYIPSGLIPAQEDKSRDLSHLNETGEILNFCGKDLLTDVVSDYLDLLGTCAAVHEVNGDYALSVYRSEWCRFLDKASRELSGIDNPDDAYRSGKWLCRKDCWEKSSKRVMETGNAIDIECCGGIRIFAVPVRAGNEVVGAVNFSYSDPPKDALKISEIASRFQVNPEKLKELANRYESRPNFIIDTAKNRLWVSARMIGTIIERKRAEIALQTAYSEIEKQVESRTAALSRSYNLLKEETRERIKAELESSQKNHALESVYAMATAFAVSLNEVIDQVVQSIRSILDTPFVALAIVEKNEFRNITQIIDGELVHFPSMPIDEHPCGISFREGRYCQISGEINRLYPNFMFQYQSMRSYIGVPVSSSKGKLLGVICALDSADRGFSEYEIHLIEIFARYVGHEIERKNMERQLIQSQEMKMLGQLTSGVAHEVRNPLNGILAITEALSNDIGENPEYITYIEHIRKQVSRLSDLMRDLLDLGRPIENSNLMPTSIMWIISTAVNIWQHSCSYREHSIRIVADEGSESVTISADRSKMEQVIINLLENACAHSAPDKEIIVSVKNGDRVVIIEVIDQGCGIKPEHFEHLFEPFFTTRRGGTGLGLGIVKRIIESHGGVIEIKNNMNTAGVTAEIQLPVVSVGVEKTESGSEKIL
ncbi:MAG: PAS domain-containing protein [Fibrobacter sp.]|nr:PAS domain-containing protein [Fibrobacter sp.]